jgi:hypothetical protein
LLVHCIELNGVYSHDRVPQTVHDDEDPDDEDADKPRGRKHPRYGERPPPPPRSHTGLLPRLRAGWQAGILTCD